MSIKIWKYGQLSIIFDSSNIKQRINKHSTMAQNTENTQIDKANEVLRELSPNVTTQDRKAAQEELGLSRYTVGNYLKGIGSDLDTAMSLIEFFRKRISLRDKKLITA